MPDYRVTYEYINWSVRHKNSSIMYASSLSALFELFDEIDWGWDLSDCEYTYSQLVSYNQVAVVREIEG